MFKYLCFNRATIVLGTKHDRIEAIEYNVGFINWKIKGKNEGKNEWLIILFQSWVSFLLIAFCNFFCFLEVTSGTSLVVQRPRVCTPSAGGPGSISGKETRSHVLQLRVSMKVKVTQSCQTLFGPMDYIVHGILQASTWYVNIY